MDNEQDCEKLQETTNSKARKFVTQNGRRRYPCDCCVCGHTFYAAQSFMMQDFNINSGCGSCPECDTFLHLEMDPDIGGFQMVSQRMSEHVARAEALEAEDNRHRARLREILERMDSEGEGETKCDKIVSECLPNLPA